MAECEFCGRDMTEADSCTKNAIAEPTGHWFYALPYGKEDRDWQSERCHDCGVTEGGTHHPGCDVETHPENGRQLLMQVISRPEEERPMHARLNADPHSEITLNDIRGNQLDDDE